jgi:hypothetical protein
MAAIAIADAWYEPDKAALAHLTPEQRSAQYEARCALLDFIDDYRDAAKTADEQAVYHAPRWQVVAGMKDLLAELVATAADACGNDERRPGLG